MTITVYYTNLHTNNCVYEEEHNDQQGNVRQSLYAQTHRMICTDCSQVPAIDRSKSNKEIVDIKL